MEKAILVLREEGGKFLALRQGRPRNGRGPHRRLLRPQDGRGPRRAALRIAVGRQERSLRRPGQRLARQVALNKPADVEELLAQKFIGDPAQTVQDRITDVVGLIRENMQPARFARLDGITGDYVHHDGTIGVLVQVKGETADPALLRDICTHIAALEPGLCRGERSAGRRGRARKGARQEAGRGNRGRQAGNIVEKIAEGKYKTWLGRERAGRSADGQSDEVRQEDGRRPAQGRQARSRQVRPLQGRRTGLIP